MKYLLTELCSGYVYKFDHVDCDDIINLLETYYEWTDEVEYTSDYACPDEYSFTLCRIELNDYMYFPTTKITSMITMYIISLDSTECFNSYEQTNGIAIQ